jgi:hypothetical protein
MGFRERCVKGQSLLTHLAGQPVHVQEAHDGKISPEGVLVHHLRQLLRDINNDLWQSWPYCLCRDGLA